MFSVMFTYLRVPYLFLYIYKRQTTVKGVVGAQGMAGEAGGDDESSIENATPSGSVLLALLLLFCFFFVFCCYFFLV